MVFDLSAYYPLGVQTFRMSIIGGGECSRGTRAQKEWLHGPIRTGSQIVTQITIVEAEPAKQKEALSLMIEPDS